MDWMGWIKGKVPDCSVWVRASKTTYSVACSNYARESNISFSVAITHLKQNSKPAILY